MINEKNPFFDNNPLFKQIKKDLKCPFCNNETEHKISQYNKDNLIYICRNCKKQFHYNRNKNKLIEEKYI